MNATRRNTKTKTKTPNPLQANYIAEAGKQPTVKVAAHLFHSLSYGNKDRLTAGIICAGWDPVEGGEGRTRGP